MITISNIDELIDFITNNFESITNDSYSELLLATLSVYTAKPLSKDEALQNIIKHHKYLHTRPKYWEKPLFMT